jgi:hypothetical protein
MKSMIKKSRFLRFIGILLMFCISVSHAQDTTSSASPGDARTELPQAQKLTSPPYFAAPTLPEHDLVLVRSNYVEDALFVMKKSQGLEQMMGHANRMSMIPPSGATLYFKGYPVGAGLLPFFTDKKALQRMHIDGGANTRYC